MGHFGDNSSRQSIALVLTIKRQKTGNTQSTKQVTTRQINCPSKSTKTLQKPEPKTVLVKTAHMSVHMIGCIVVHTAQSSPDNLPSYPADSHRSSDVVYWR